MLGVHVSKESHVLDDKTVAKDLSVAVTRDVEALKLNCAQIFTFGPRFIVANKIDFEALVDATKDIDLSVHSAYATTSIWKVNKSNKTTDDSKKRLLNIKAQLLSCVKANAWGIVLHINRISPSEAKETMSILKPIVKKTTTMLILEMVSSKSHPEKTYETPEKIDNLTTLIGPNETWWGWCVDTAHLWGAGVDIASYENMKAWLDSLTYKKKVVMFHLNGSSAVRGSGADKHEAAFSPSDLIWKDKDPKKSGVRAIMEFASIYKIPVICEINRGSEADIRKSIATIKSLIPKKSVEDSIE